MNESLRILRTGGVVYFSTTNRLCPIQQEFKLPLYGWYPAALKRYCERLAVTTHPHWVQYASFPAVNWFTFYQFREYLRARGVDAMDRFDVMDPKGSTLRSAVLGAFVAPRPCAFAGTYSRPTRSSLGSSVRPSRTVKNAVGYGWLTRACKARTHHSPAPDCRMKATTP